MPAEPAERRRARAASGGVGAGGDHAAHRVAEGDGDGGFAARLDLNDIDDGPEQPVHPFQGRRQAGPEVTEGGVEGVGAGGPAVDPAVSRPAGLVRLGGLPLGGLAGQPGRFQSSHQRRLVELLDPGGDLLLGQAGQPAADRVPPVLEAGLLGLGANHRAGQDQQFGPGLGRRLAGGAVAGRFQLGPGRQASLPSAVSTSRPTAGSRARLLPLRLGQVGTELGRLGRQGLDHPGVGQCRQ